MIRVGNLVAGIKAPPSGNTPTLSISTVVTTSTSGFGPEARTVDDSIMVFALPSGK